MTRYPQDQSIKPTFARHETFHPRYGWLKKGFDKNEVFSKAKDRDRVVLGVGQNMVNAIRYWCLAFKILEKDNGFYSNLSKGGKIEYDVYPELQEAGKKAVSEFGEKTGINLAGVDILFSFDESAKQHFTPLFLEINYFFGRRGLGGSDKFYDILVQEINGWLNGLGLSLNAK